METLKSVIDFCSPFLDSYQTSLVLLLKALLTQVESKVKYLMCYQCYCICVSLTAPTTSTIVYTRTASV